MPQYRKEIDNKIYEEDFSEPNKIWLLFAFRGEPL